MSKASIRDKGNTRELAQEKCWIEADSSNYFSLLFTTFYSSKNPWVLQGEQQQSLGTFPARAHALETIETTRRNLHRVLGV